jgi:hypothetical protein
VDVDMNAVTDSTRFSDTESEEFTVYRPVNRWAIIAAVFGGLSAASLLHPALLAFPLVGLFAGLMAVRPVRCSTGNTTWMVKRVAVPNGGWNTSAREISGWPIS